MNIDAAFLACDDVLYQVRNTVKKLDMAGLQLAVKSFRIPRWPQSSIYARWRPSKAERSFKNAHTLLERGITTPDPVACIQTVYRGRLGKSYYVSLYHQHDHSMQPVFTRLDDPALSTGEKQADFALLSNFVDFTYAMHEAGVLHIDHNAGNTLVSSKDGKNTFAVIDINRMRFGKPGMRARLNNFVRLTDNEEAMQFIAHRYAELAGCDKHRCAENLLKLKRKHLDKIALKRKLKGLLQKRGKAYG